PAPEDNQKALQVQRTSTACLIRGFSPLPLPKARQATRSSQIFFTTAARLRHPRTVRKSVTAWLLLLAALPCARGQDQERKLLDRILKPDMSLQNEAQNKKFIADGASTK